MPPLKTDRRLNVEIIRVARTSAAGKRLVNVFAGEKMTEASLQLSEFCDSVSGDGIHFSSKKTVVVGMDSVSTRTAGRAAGVVREVVRIREPEAVSFQREQGLDASVTALRVIADELRCGLQDLQRIFER